MKKIFELNLNSAYGFTLMLKFNLLSQAIEPDDYHFIITFVICHLLTSNSGKVLTQEIDAIKQMKFGVGFGVGFIKIQSIYIGECTDRESQYSSCHCAL